MKQVILIVGRSNSGKTTLLEKLIPELQGRGYRVGTIKHATQFEIDQPGKDSYRHFQAGAQQVIVASDAKIALLRRQDTPPTLEGLIAAYCQDIDLVFVEGHKSEARPKIEVFRSDLQKTPVCLDDTNLIAFVGDIRLTDKVPYFLPTQIMELADLIEQRVASPDVHSEAD